MHKTSPQGRGHTLVYTDLVVLRVELQLGMTQSGLQGPSVRRRLFPFTPTLSPFCCFSTALLTPSIHSRPTESAELRESTATQGIYGNLKILTSAIVHYTQYSANSLRLTPTNLLFCALGRFLTPLNGSPRLHSCLLLFNLFLFSFLSVSSSLTQIFWNGKHQRDYKRRVGGRADELLIYCLLCWINVVVISLVVVSGEMKW